ncbi:MAG: 50S ribosomal protein L3, partial [Cyanobacteria bacterium P01_A01_bin.3]
MAVGIFGKKLGMTQVFDEEGLAVPVTVVEAGPCTVTQIKTKETDGYTAIQIGYGNNKRLNKPEKGHLAKAGVEASLKHLKEYRVDAPEDFELGQELTVNRFEAGQLIDVSGTTI